MLSAGLHIESGLGINMLTPNRGKPRRSMLRRAVFSDGQRKGLERTFQKQRYISKPDRKKLADRLGLKDTQVTGLLVLKWNHVKWKHGLTTDIKHANDNITNES